MRLSPGIWSFALLALVLGRCSGQIGSTDDAGPSSDARTQASDARVDTPLTPQLDSSSVVDARVPPGVDSATRDISVTTVQDTSTPIGPLPPSTPPYGGSSSGTGGTVPLSGQMQTVDASTTYWLVVPSSYRGGATPLLLFITGNGIDPGPFMAETLYNAGPITGTDDMIRAVIDGRVGDGHYCERVLDHVRSRYNVDNDRTYLISNSAGTPEGQELGFILRPAWFAAYWVNDLTSVFDAPRTNASALGFAPWGNAGPGGNVGSANEVVAAMRAHGYRLPAQAPYMGPGYERHGSAEQGLASISFMAGKSRR